jgi:hypothetical protein
MNGPSRELPGLQVDEREGHTPRRILHRGRWSRVETVLTHWRLQQEWWKRPVERDYFLLRLEGGLICEVFRDAASGRWWLQRMYD